MSLYSRFCVISLFFTFFIFHSHSIQCQNFNVKDTNIVSYIEKYKNYAISEMNRVGIPPSIKLAQGIVETDAGVSDLVKRSNNHFGVKCKKEWQGDTVRYDDDAAQECFRKYLNDSLSYVDQSDFLKKSPRYKKLFETDPLDYNAWAKELKNAGYATNPSYVKLLVKIIEEYGLQKITLDALLDNGKINQSLYLNLSQNVIYKKKNYVDSIIAYRQSYKDSIKAIANKINVDNLAPDFPIPSQQNESLTVASTAQTDLLKEILLRAKNDQIKNDSFISSRQTQSEIRFVSKNKPSDSNLNYSEHEKKLDIELVLQEPSHAFVHVSVNRLKAITAPKGTSLLFIASKFDIQFHQLLSYNNLSANSNLLLNDQIVYLESKKRIGSIEFHIVKKGETLYDISQKEGIDLVSLRQFNFMPKNAEPKENQKIYLMSFAPQRPEINLQD